MMGSAFGILLDVIIVTLLGATIFYTIRLYNSLNSFRAHRDEFDSVITRLVSCIAQAEHAIKNLKDTGAKEAAHLEQMIRQSKALSEELQLVCEAGENMAKRLEDLAEKNRKIAQKFETNTSYSEKEIIRAPQVQKKEWEEVKIKKEAFAKTPIASTVVKERIEPIVDSELPAFMMKERSKENELRVKEVVSANVKQEAAVRAEKFPGALRPNMLAEKQKTQGISENELESQAERDLFAALQVHKRRPFGDRES